MTPLGSIGIRGTYNRLAADEVGGVSYDGHFNMLEVLAVGQISLVAGPHFLAGLGMTRWDGEFGVTDIAAETDFTAVAGVGMTFVMFDVTALYHNIATEGNASSYFTLSAGLGF